jgi:hypothetical protein
MSNEELNKYIELHGQYIDLLVDYHNHHLVYLEKRTVRNTRILKRHIKLMREKLKELWKSAQQTRYETIEEKREQWRSNNVDISGK